MDGYIGYNMWVSVTVQYVFKAMGLTFFGSLGTGCGLDADMNNE